jgi:hypothetical protein
LYLAPGNDGARAPERSPQSHAVRRLLNRYDYPSDKEERAIQLVSEEQAELLADAVT